MPQALKASDEVANVPEEILTGSLQFSKLMTRPRYIKAFTAHIIIYAIQLAAIVFLRIVLMRRNQLKRRAQSLEESKSEHIAHRRAFEDLTDQENPDFRYVY
ncbi:hypothetical protein BT96DRAFT_983848 [Gymnopus androsaceus JB14]|uniref:Uncharacterized protein n=1 Tax=Gymnopus androsaceus JB14 TaxID=1447944 RepID=A0A6A4IL60_9AGAR|nr:hypothetical protein BT96DRAFT_983848 [Gymnopus androsaceus JB14]